MTPRINKVDNNTDPIPAQKVRQTVRSTPSDNKRRCHADEVDRASTHVPDDVLFSPEALARQSNEAKSPTVVEKTGKRAVEEPDEGCIDIKA